uniref:BTB domain-containing protein n=1 Tax=Anopheles epiroticus TaxID=199890 RepID=A0A182PMZ3_9DIPT
MADDEQFSLCWNNFNSNLSAGFHESLQRGDLVDVTLAAEGHLVKAHRLILSVCSPYFRKMFTQVPVNQHAFIFLKDVSHSALQDLIQFMYCGEVNVKQDALPAFISTAEALQIKGLTETGDSAPTHQSPVKEETPAAVPVAPATISTSTTSPSASQRAKVQRNRIQSYKLESEESGDDKVVHIQASTSHHVSAQQLQVQASSQKRTIPQRGLPSQTSKRTKMSISASSDGLDSSDTTPAQVQTVQTVQIVKQLPQVIEPEYIELPIESINPKAEPDYTDETAEIEAVDAETEQEHKLSEHEQGEADDDGNYVEDDTYGDMAMSKYDESYLTEGEEGTKAGVSGFVDSYTSDGGTGTEQSTQVNQISMKSVALTNVSHIRLKDLEDLIFAVLDVGGSDQSSTMRSTDVDDAYSFASRMGLLQTIKKEGDVMIKDEPLHQQLQLPLRNFNANEASSSGVDWSQSMNVAKNSANVSPVRRSMRMIGGSRKEAATNSATVSGRKSKPDDKTLPAASVTKFHELKKSHGSPAQRNRCVSCYNRNILESERMPNPKTKWVTTFCDDCPGKPFLCIFCFSKIHCRRLSATRRQFLQQALAKANVHERRQSLPASVAKFKSLKVLAVPSTVSVSKIRTNEASSSRSSNIRPVKHITSTVKFIRSQKKCAQLVHEGYIYNRKTVHQNGRTSWRCCDLLKYHCKASCVTKLNQLVSIRNGHNHEDHSSKLTHKTLFDFPEDLEEYVNIRTQGPIDVVNHKVDVIDTGAEYKIVVSDRGNEKQSNVATEGTMLLDKEDLIEEEYMDDRKGGLQLVHENYLYRSNLRRQGRNGDVLYWECIYNRGQKCRGRLKTIGNEVVITNGRATPVLDTTTTNSSSNNGDHPPSGCLVTNSTVDSTVELKFIKSPWSTPCLVLNNFLYNCHSTRGDIGYWRCHNYSRKVKEERCRARCVVKGGRLSALTGAQHNHPPHTEKIERIMRRNYADEMQELEMMRIQQQQQQLQEPHQPQQQQQQQQQEQDQQHMQTSENILLLMATDAHQNALSDQQQVVQQPMMRTIRQQVTSLDVASTTPPIISSVTTVLSSAITDLIKMEDYDLPTVEFQRGLPLLVKNNFIYRCERTRNLRSYWLCIRYKTHKCNGRIICQSNAVLKETDHCHMDDRRRLTFSERKLIDLSKVNVGRWVKSVPPEFITNARKASLSRRLVATAQKEEKPDRGNYRDELVS